MTSFKFRHPWLQINLATASSIFLTTATDIVSMGLFLGLATWLIR